jgi:polysaccharide biosynthesis/export protein
MRPSRLIVFVLALVALMVAGCVQRSAMPPLTDIVASAPLAMAPEEAPYSLDSGDRLRVVVFGQEGLSAIYAVDASGNITMPLIGAVHARGTSPASLSRTIADKLRQGYIREPHVAVEIEAYRPFFILGEVTTPGQYAYVPNMSVENAVAIAGGFTPRAQRRTIVLSRTIDGIPVRGPVPADTPVRPGDTIVVQERWF